MTDRKKSTKQYAKPDRKAPKAGRPIMPAAYGLSRTKRGMLTWDYVNERMEASRNYWICTTRPDGRPHAVPVWGMWINERLYFGTDRRTRKARNLAENPAVVVHLESGDDAVIIEGVAEEVDENDAETLALMDEASKKKYGMGVSGPPGTVPVIYAVRPRIVLAWGERDFPTSATRWEVEPA